MVMHEIELRGLSIEVVKVGGTCCIEMQMRQKL
jgi:hypothetical protein